MLRSKPKGSHNADYSSFDQEKHRHMECANNVRGGENFSTGSRNAEIQPRSTRALRNTMDPVRTTATNNRRKMMPLTQRGLPSYWGRRHREHLMAGKPEDRGA